MSFNLHLHGVQHGALRALMLLVGDSKDIRLVECSVKDASILAEVMEHQPVSV